MTELDDNDLLAEYARTGSEAAFATLVSRYVNLVHSAAIRFTNNPNHAEEITQAVFIILARKASSLRRDSVLSAWLYQTARLTAANFMRRDIGRQIREQEVYLDSTATEPEAIWEQIAPLLDQAMGRLGETDRKAIMLRYFENKTTQQVAAKLKLNEEAAKKRVNRALEKLRKIFAQHGIVLRASVIAALVSANSVQAAPTALATSISAVGITKGAAASGSTLTLIKGVLKTMAWTKVKTAIVVSVSVLLAAGTATVGVKTIAANRHEAWQKKYDLAVLDTVPPQVSILPSLPATLQSNLQAAGMRNNKALALGQSVRNIIARAYGIPPARIIPDVPIPDGKYDFIANLTQGVEANQEGLRQEIKRKFGLIGRREQVETNVLVLTVQSGDAAGLRRSAGRPAGLQTDDSYSAHHQTIWTLVNYLEQSLHVVVLDQTGLTDNFDIDFQWDKTPEGLKRVLLDELGLKLSPGKQAVEFVKVEKAK
jgi:uncharacterized protein (TIGR03435 family)